VLQIVALLSFSIVSSQWFGISANKLLPMAKIGLFQELLSRAPLESTAVWHAPSSRLACFLCGLGLELRALRQFMGSRLLGILSQYGISLLAKPQGIRDDAVSGDLQPFADALAVEVSGHQKTHCLRFDLCYSTHHAVKALTEWKDKRKARLASKHVQQGKNKMR